MAQKAKAADKQTASKKIVALLKKRYKESPPREDLPVLETMVYAACLENSTTTAANDLYAKLFETFHDLNEMRVSSITELSELIEHEEKDRKAHQIRSSLQYVFEKNFAFEFEGIKKKTLEAAVKQLQKMKDLSPFSRNYTLHLAIGAHVIPVDDRMTRAAIWLGLADVGSNADHAGESLKSAVRKPEASQFCHFLRCLANDPAVRKEFERPHNPADGEFDANTAYQRLTDLLERPAKKAAPAKKGKPVAKAAKAPKAKKPATKAGKPSARTSAKKKTKSRA